MLISRSIRVVMAMGLLIGGTIVKADEPPIVLTPQAIVETEAVPNGGDAADDPAIWVDSAEPSKSLVLGTDKKGGLCVFDLEGKLLQIVSNGSQPNNVDVIRDFPIGGTKRDLAVAGLRAKGKQGVGFWSIDPTTRKLTEVDPFPAFSVFDGCEPYGSCVYRSPKDGAWYVFVSNKDGEVEQYRLKVSREGVIEGEKVRRLSVGSQVEGCVADSELGRLYVGEEDVAIWSYSAEPDGGSDRKCVAKVGEHGLEADVEGLTILPTSRAEGYLIASSQGNSTFAVFERGGSNSFVGTIDPKAGAIADVEETDGLDATPFATSPKFPNGMLVVQDGVSETGRQNFKFFSWSDIAGNQLRLPSGR